MLFHSLLLSYFLICMIYSHYWSRFLRRCKNGITLNSCDMERWQQLYTFLVVGKSTYGMNVLTLIILLFLFLVMSDIFIFKVNFMRIAEKKQKNKKNRRATIDTICVVGFQIFDIDLVSLFKYWAAISLMTKKIRKLSPYCSVAF